MFRIVINFILKLTTDTLEEIVGSIDSSSFNNYYVDNTELEYREIIETYYQWDKKDYEEWKKL